MAQATDTRITPTTDFKTAALQAADAAAREPDRLKRRELEQQALRLWQAARRCGNADEHAPRYRPGRLQHPTGKLESRG